MAKPKIRFKGFSDEWIEKTLDEWGTFYYGKSCPKWSVEENAPTPCIRYGELYTKFGSRIDKIYSYTNIPPENLRFSTGREVLIPRVGEDPKDYNHCTWLPFEGVAIGEMISVFNTEQDPFFAASMFNATLRDEFAVRVEGFSVTNLYFEKLKDIRVSFPSIEEQKKIGALLSALDNQIALREQELAQQRLLKRYFLQRMFPQEGQDVPELRFAGFSNPWKKCELGAVVNVQCGRDYKHLSTGNIPVYGTGGYMLSVNEALSYDEDAIGIGRKGTIDKPYILRAPFWTVDTLFYAVPHPSRDLEFVYCLFQNVDWAKKDESTGVPSLSKTIINSQMVIIPDILEQKKIGAFFSSLDGLIEHREHELALLRKLKVFLLQNMFPEGE